jgi:DNA mismatch repair protein MutL
VVKELLENAVDAGASSVDLFVKDAGKTLIQVADNGCGMSALDARMSFERHATSKIEKADDLFAIRTMGFRGEALASIAAIAQVEMKTRLSDEELGTCLKIEGSKVIQEEPCPCQPGTVISVKNLFFNVPARRNFLKSDSVETRHMIEEFTRVALINYDVAFSFVHNNKVVFKLPKSSFKARIVNIFGKSYDQKLLPVEQTTGSLSIKGFIGKPEFAKKTRGEQYFFVNKRFIKHPYLHHAVENAFAELLPSDAYPSYFLDIEIDPSEIDVNIHPTKTEVNFIDARYVYAVMQSAVKQAIGKHSLTPTIDFDVDPAIDALFQTTPKGEVLPPETQINPDYNPFDQQNGQPKPAAFKPAKRQSEDEWNQLHQPLIEENSEKSILSSGFSNGQKEPSFDPAHRFFQVHHRYILTNVRSGLMIIDQQKAHERILYERFLAKMENNEAPASQQQLFPITIQFSAGDAELIRSMKDSLQKLGFVREPIGANGFVFQGIPQGMSASETESVIEQILEVQKQRPENMAAGKNTILAKSLASKLSIKAGKKLSHEEMANLFDELFACQLPDVAPDGSPVVSIVPIEELERFLKEKK